MLVETTVSIRVEPGALLAGVTTHLKPTTTVLNAVRSNYPGASWLNDMARSCPDSRSRAFNVPIAPMPQTAGQLYAPVANRSYPSLRLLRISAPAGSEEGGILRPNSFEE